MSTTAAHSEGANRPVANALAKSLADTYGAYLKTQNYHWNVAGPHFRSLHALFEEQYTELAVAVDEIAERIRTLGARAPGSYSEFASLGSVAEPLSEASAEEMVVDLERTQQSVIATHRQARQAAETADDQETMDLLTQRIAVHQKAAWMLRSSMG